MLLSSSTVGVTSISTPMFLTLMSCGVPAVIVTPATVMASLLELAPKDFRLIVPRLAIARIEPPQPSRMSHSPFLIPHSQIDQCSPTSKAGISHFLNDAVKSACESLSTRRIFCFKAFNFRIVSSVARDLGTECNTSSRSHTASSDRIIIIHFTGHSGV